MKRHVLVWRLWLCVSICLAIPVLGIQQTKELYVGPGGSPHVMTEWTLHGARISVTYGRPYLKGRRVGATVVPYDKVHRVGADDYTVLTTDRPLKFKEGLQLPAGHYTLFTIPQERRWTLIVQQQSGPKGQRHTPSLEAGRLTMAVKELDKHVEQFTIDLRPARERDVVLSILFGHVQASVPFTVGNK